ncbi:MAG: alpha/beta fold hydrolase [Legionella sp.]|nr:MAG: alpha/beta fold hydrolase [Legionella sp.]
MNRYLQLKSLVLILLFLFITSAAYPLQSKEAFKNTPATTQTETVVLVHGLLRSSISMFFLKHFLQHQGYEVYSYNYPSAKYNIHQHAQSFEQYLLKFMREHPSTRVHFVTHSLGGIVVRETLANLSDKQLQQIGYLIMLAPPSQGSAYANAALHIPLINKLVAPLKELSSDKQSYVHQVPIPKVKMGIISGHYDTVVPRDAAYLNSETERVEVNAMHTFIMNNNKAKQFILTFLKKGSFNNT